MKWQSEGWHIIRGAGCIIVFASLIGAGVNLPFVMDVLQGEKTFNAEERIEAVLQNAHLVPITLADARRAFDENSAIFVDSRSEEEYAEGHIPGAVNLPWVELDTLNPDLLDRIPGGLEIITYCGESCESSAELAEALVGLGYTEVKVLLNGWPLWVEAGYPMESLK